MSTFYINKEQIEDNTIRIIGEDLHHIKDVLRVKSGEKLDFCDEDAIRYNCKLSKYGDSFAIFEILSKTCETTESCVNITLYQGLPRQERMDLVVQKASELGVQAIIPVNMDRSILKIDDKNESKKIDRWNKIAKEACSQSGRQKLSIVSRPVNFKNIIENIEKYDIVLLPYENEKVVSLKEALKTFSNKESKSLNIAVIIGPEGGFSDSEISSICNISNVKVVTLGKRILRTETAGPAVAAMLLYEFEL